MYRVGLIINPFAGIGGRAGLKGSDGKKIQQLALAAGFHSLAPQRAAAALLKVLPIRENLEIITYPREMGEDIAKEAGFLPHVIGFIDSGNTTGEDTIKAARDMRDYGVDVIFFAGGDGTARNICTAVRNSLPVLGLPCGVKMHSAVYAITPSRAGEILRMFLEQNNRKTSMGEVMDIDEEAFRQGEVRAKLYGYLQVPQSGVFMQKMKAGCYSQAGELISIAAAVVDGMEEDVLYIIGPGSTTEYVMKDMNLPNTLLGVDVVKNRKLLASDLNEQQLWDVLVQHKKAKIVVTAIGGQGHIFGRGNQQISPRIIRRVGKENIIVIASRQKLVDLLREPFLVDTGDPELDQSLCGFTKVPMGGNQVIPYKISR